MRRMPSCMITASSYWNVGSYEMQFGITAWNTCEWPSSCCRPSPFSVVRPEVPPSRKPRERMSAAAQHRSPIRWMPNIE
ncbi:hypothetical protein D3C86_1454770 [compost metagenome]